MGPDPTKVFYPPWCLYTEPPPAFYPETGRPTGKDGFCIKGGRKQNV